MFSIAFGGKPRSPCGDLAAVGGLNPIGFSIFGIGVDRKHILKWLFPQEKATFHGSKQVYMYSENALISTAYGPLRRGGPSR
jgi:hypothetical protein